MSLALAPCTIYTRSGNHAWFRTGARPAPAHAPSEHRRRRRGAPPSRARSREYQAPSNRRRLPSAKAINKGGKKKPWRAYRRPPPPSARHWSARASSIRRTPFQFYGDFLQNEWGSHLQHFDGSSSKVVEAGDDLSWLDQFGTMDDCVDLDELDDGFGFFDGADGDSDDYDSESIPVEVEL